MDQRSNRSLLALALVLLFTTLIQPAAGVAKLRAALLGLKEQPGGKEIMAALHKGLTALIPARESGYDQLRTIVHKVEALR